MSTAVHDLPAKAVLGRLSLNTHHSRGVVVAASFCAGGLGDMDEVVIGSRIASPSDVGIRMRPLSSLADNGILEPKNAVSQARSVPVKIVDPTDVCIRSELRCALEDVRTESVHDGDPTVLVQSTTHSNVRQVKQPHVNSDLSNALKALCEIDKMHNPLIMYHYVVVNGRGGYCPIPPSRKADQARDLQLIELYRKAAQFFIRAAGNTNPNEQTRQTIEWYMEKYNEGGKQKRNKYDHHSVAHITDYQAICSMEISQLCFYAAQQSNIAAHFLEESRTPHASKEGRKDALNAYHAAREDADVVQFAIMVQLQKRAAA